MSLALEQLDFRSESKSREALILRSQFKTCHNSLGKWHPSFGSFMADQLLAALSSIWLSEASELLMMFTSYRPPLQLQEPLRKLPGSVRLLALDDGKYIHESLAMIEYFEDHAGSRGLPTKRGSTPEERARVRNLLGLAEQITIAIELAAVHGCIIFAGKVEDQQNAAAVRYMLKHCHKNLSRIEEYASSKGPFVVEFGCHHETSQGTIADCVVFATLQYALELLGIDLTKDHPRLRRFYDAFKARPSAVIPDGAWPSHSTAMTKKWIEY